MSLPGARVGQETSVDRVLHFHFPIWTQLRWVDAGGVWGGVAESPTWGGRIDNPPLMSSTTRHTTRSRGNRRCGAQRVSGPGQALCGDSPMKPSPSACRTSRPRGRGGGSGVGGAERGTRVELGGSRGVSPGQGGWRVRGRRMEGRTNRWTDRWSDGWTWGMEMGDRWVVDGDDGDGWLYKGMDGWKWR